ncbi:B-type flagellar protein FliS [Cellvibrio zantedeschiae]|uniref:Flagellar secretion chaperone FliS n=1 Tax=Cellvibrio zantedeschiae TaxID=1237077 RepID=A0ABQ3AWG8_9GAMM|nr:flagellar export chaperone FliS [Cellvibrio zantedeschiae]GGY70066.1 B-type flagellar protein FliS [Cellvibrio zantedeschiae]
MSNYNSQEALKQYRQLGLETQINNASPHRLIQLLMEGALERLNGAKAAIDRGDTATKGALIGKAMGIISGLRASLDMSVEGTELPERLDNLYDYMGRRLLEASAFNKAEIVSEVIELLKTIKSGWDGIEPQAAP